MHLSRFRPRLTVRRLMVAVAIAGLVLGAMGLASRRSAYRIRAFDHEVQEVLYREGFEQTTVNPKRSAYHAAMKDKYRHAVRYPWLPVAPDPPEPQ